MFKAAILVIMGMAIFTFGFKCPHKKPVKMEETHAVQR